ncbi:hypothetical protein Tco_0804737 [Tanacetum coccineum]|uniref:Uncharacterized protein n=1 Tax=Tanacetum coccineum TaxID=301880 RepID=A0ABQ5A555_9ASTR
MDATVGVDWGECRITFDKRKGVGVVKKDLGCVEQLRNAVKILCVPLFELPFARLRLHADREHTKVLDLEAEISNRKSYF